MLDAPPLYFDTNESKRHCKNYSKDAVSIEIEQVCLNIGLQRWALSSFERQTKGWLRIEGT